MLAWWDASLFAAGLHALDARAFDNLEQGSDRLLVLHPQPFDLHEVEAHISRSDLGKSLDDVLMFQSG